MELEARRKLTAALASLNAVASRSTDWDGR